MEIHKYEKIWLAASFVLILALIATVTYGTVAVGVKMIDKSGTIKPSQVSEHPKFGDPGVRKTGKNTYDVYVVARRFAFQPGTNQPIRLPEGSKVTFHVTSPDVIHGFEVVGTNVNTMVIPGQVSVVTAYFNETDTYGLVCNEYCGSGHHYMAGKIEVLPRSEYNVTAMTVSTKGGDA
ncbi:MAG: cytochrome c oxidase subunit II [Halobacteria archaeon]|nr:cytochrome c oxidase subunit II [Halobacteria archaeon]